MWLLLKENLSNKFKNECNYTYLFPINKNNFFIGKNNSGKSYFSRFLMKNTIKIYRDKSELMEEICQKILNVKSKIITFTGLRNKKINNIVISNKGMYRRYSDDFIVIIPNITGIMIIKFATTLFSLENKLFNAYIHNINANTKIPKSDLEIKILKI